MEAIAKALNLDTSQKRYMPSMSREMAEYLKTFEGLDYLKYSQILTQKLQLENNIYGPNRRRRRRQQRLGLINCVVFTTLINR
ncbi:MAG: hypothetical protein EZS28_019275 [Streblomastix strix]|uniref:Uncharacterized protein n=1 Tax=Streblomastix strix TaxID=222440 RepID=A0A5J4VRB6_9EUKA|nr:MAG: hypothetical protein EZS28_019275 [Streblomastix strix]